MPTERNGRYTLRAERPRVGALRPDCNLSFEGVLAVLKVAPFALEHHELRDGQRIRKLVSNRQCMR